MTTFFPDALTSLPRSRGAGYTGTAAGLQPRSSTDLKMLEFGELMALSLFPAVAQQSHW